MEALRILGFKPLAEVVGLFKPPDSCCPSPNGDGEPNLPSEGRPDGVGILKLLFGGRGKAAILTDRRTSLLARLASRVAAFEVDRNVGTSGVDTTCRGIRRAVGSPDVEGVRTASFEAV